MAVAVIQTGGKQYVVREGDIVNVEKLAGTEGDELTFDDMLHGGKVTCKLLGTEKGKKKIVFHYKSKTRRRVKRGHRQPHSTVKVIKILTNSE